MGEEKGQGVDWEHLHRKTTPSSFNLAYNGQGVHSNAAVIAVHKALTEAKSKRGVELILDRLGRILEDGESLF